MAQAFGDDDGDERIPDLSQLPQERWLDALRPLSRHERMVACDRVHQAEVSVVLALIGQLTLEDGDARARAVAARPPRMPVGDPPRPMQTVRRQVNFRLGDDEHARLREAARLFGMRPNVLARVLTVRGVDRALIEAASGR